MLQMSRSANKTVDQFLAPVFTQVLLHFSVAHKAAPFPGAGLKIRSVMPTTKERQNLKASLKTAWQFSCLTTITVMETEEENMCMAPLLQVKYGSGPGAHALIQKQAVSTGTPYWKRPRPSDPLLPNQVEIYASCTNSGPDEDVAKKIATHECDDADVIGESYTIVVIFVSLRC